MPEQLARYEPHTDNPIHTIHEINSIGANMFDFMLFPRPLKDPEVLFSAENRGKVLGFLQTVQEGLPLVTRRDDPNYDPSTHDGKFVRNAQKSEVDMLLDDLGLEVNEEPGVMSVDPSILPKLKQTILTYGHLHRMYSTGLPYREEFGIAAQQFWGRDLTVQNIRKLTDRLTQRVHYALYSGAEKDYVRLLPPAQFFAVGSVLSDNLMRQTLNTQPSIRIPFR